MRLNRRVPLLLSIALLLAVLGIFTRTARAQTNGLELQQEASCNLDSQTPHERCGPSLLNYFEIGRVGHHQVDNVKPAGNPDLDVPMLMDTSSAGTTSAVPPLPDPPKPSDEGWHFGIAPYLWFAGVHGTVGALGHEGSVHASFRDVLSNFNVGLMFAVEPRHNRIVMPFDFMWIKLSDDKALPFEVGPTSVKVKINEFMLTQKIGYRVIDSEKFKVDGLAGFRYWHLGNTLTLQPQISNSFYASANWVDAVGGARIQAKLSPKVTLTVLGDAGGGGANSDYQVAGLLGWNFKKFSLQGGWRYMSVNYRPSGGVRFIYDMATSGLIFGATIPLK